MKENELKYSKYTFKLKSPLNISNRIINEKDVILLSYITDRDKIHYGEVSPLFGFSSEKIEQCEELLQNSEKISDIIKRNEISTLQNKYSSYPSLLFGIEQIIFFGELSESKYSFENKSIKNNALVGIKSERKTLEELKRFVDAGQYYKRWSVSIRGPLKLHRLQSTGRNGI